MIQLEYKTDIEIDGYSADVDILYRYHAGEPKTYDHPGLSPWVDIEEVTVTKVEDLENPPPHWQHVYDLHYKVLQQREEELLENAAYKTSGDL